MKYIITGSLGNISLPVTQNLVKAGHQVVVISSNANKKEQIEGLGAEAAIGSVRDVAFLQSAFEGGDVTLPDDPLGFFSYRLCRIPARSSR